ncbi:MAG: hypothetical protein KDA33_10570, partial [Phycisphaerales bacterium]|nr:hypothetical protein [Phycisphaerales bacterium]
GTRNLFEWLKGAIHDGAPTPASLLDKEHRFSRAAVAASKALIEAWPRLRRLVEALSWLYYLNPGDFAKAIHWARDHAAFLDRLLADTGATTRLSDALTLIELVRRDSEKSLRPLMTALADPRCFTCSTTRDRQLVEQLRSALASLKKLGEAKSLPTPSAVRNVETLLSLARWLFLQERGARRRAMAMFERVMAPIAFEAWEQYWMAAEALIERLRVMQRNSGRQISKREFGETRQAIDALESMRPGNLSIETVVENVQYASLGVRAPFHKVAIACLDSLPRDPARSALRSQFLQYWLQTEAENGVAITPYLREFRRYLRNADDADLWLTPWREVYEKNGGEPRGRWTMPDMQIIEEKPAPRLWRRVFDAMGLIIRASGAWPSDRTVSGVVTLAEVSSSAEEARDRYLALCRLDPAPAYFDDIYCACAARLSDDADEFASVFALFNAQQDHIPPTATEFIRFCDVVERAGWPRLVREAMIDGQQRRIDELRRLAGALASLGRMVGPTIRPDRNVEPNWAKRYPPALHAPLALLDALEGDAEGKARRLLDRVFPDQARIAREIAALEAPVSDATAPAALRVRLDRLRARERDGYVADRSQERKSLERIQRAIRDIVMDRWRRELRAGVAAALKAMWGEVGDVSAILSPRDLEGLVSALSLNENKALALELYRRRCGPAPWDMRDHPANQAFLRRMDGRNIDMAPWLETRSPWEWRADDRTRLTMNFEEDPLEIFQMGAMFGTCLTPGRFSYFSVFANAADVNKKTLYGRDDKGRIVARCLFAVSDHGGLLVFNPYCHITDIDFCGYVRRLANDLARRMNTVVVPRGQTSALVAEDWYDDGPRDVCDRFDCLKDGSTFRKRLLDVDPGGVRRLVEAAFAPLPINALTLTFLMELKEIGERPEIILPLIG